MTFWDDVYELREKGKIERLWKAGDLIAHLSNSPKTVNTNPPNYSVTRYGDLDGGFHVKSGSKPRAWRHGGDTWSFELIKDPDDDAATQDREAKLSLERANALISLLSSGSQTRDSSRLSTHSSRVQSVESGQSSYPLRESPYRYDDPFEPVALEDWEFLRANSQFGIETPRWNITYEFARWATHSALRNPGSPIRSRAEVYTALSVVDFKFLFNKKSGPIDKSEFDTWHRDAISKLCGSNSKLQVGWAAKIIAIYLKTTCYLAGFGREGLECVIHPPIDNVLIQNLRKRSWMSPGIASGLRRFGTISGMDLECYGAIIRSFELIAKERGCTLFEVEQYFRPR